MSHTKSYQYFLNPEGNFIGPNYLHEEQTNFSKAITDLTLYQTNIKNIKELEIYKSERISDAKLYFSEFSTKNANDLPSKFGVKLFESYLFQIDSYLSPNIICPLVSNQLQIESILSQLTEIFFFKGYKFGGLEQVWMLFLENIHKQLKQERQKYEFTKFISKTHICDVFKHNTPSKWGWYELHIQSFVNGFIDSLIKGLSINQELGYNNNSLLTIYNFSKEINAKIEKMYLGKKKSNGFSTLGDYLSENQVKLKHSIESFDSKRLEVSLSDDEEVVLSNENESLDFKENILSSLHESSLKIIDEKSDKEIKQTKNEVTNLLKENITNDFLDLIIGKNRKDKEARFGKLMKLLPKGLITINESGYKWNLEFFKENTAKTKLQMYVYSFYSICLDEGYISIDKLSPIESVSCKQIGKKIRQTFQIYEEVTLSDRMFKKHELIQLKKKSIYFIPFKGMIPKR